MKRFLIITYVSIFLIQLNINPSSNCYAAEGYKSTGSYQGAQGYNGNAGYQSSGGYQSSSANKNSNSQNQNEDDDASDDGQLTPQEQNQIMQNAQKWFDNNPDQAKMLMENLIK